MKQPQITIRDLALKLNLSISTVSRALRHAPDINPETKMAVLEMAKNLRYEPNRVAQSLRNNKTKTLGVVVPQIALHFFSSSISGIQEYAAGRGYTIMICQTLESFETEQANIQMLLSNRVDGLLISLSTQTRTFNHLKYLIEKETPIILFDRVCDELDVSKVVVDDYDGAYKAVEYLVYTGCREIAYLGGPETLYISQQRKAGYLDALRNYNLDISETRILHCQDLQRDVESAVHTLLDLQKRPDAIFCIHDLAAITAMQVAKERKIHIPDELSIVGFTNEPVSQYIEPALTTVAQPAYEIGREAARLFFDQAMDKETVNPVKRVIPTELIIRGTTKLIG